MDQVFNGVLLNIKFRVKDRKILRRKIILIDLKTNFTLCGGTTKYGVTVNVNSFVISIDCTYFHMWNSCL